MRIGRYWARSQMHAIDPRGEAHHRSFLRASFESEADAQRIADQAAQQLKSQIERGTEPKDWYLYADRTRAEPLIEEIRSEYNQRIGALTVNAYGACILNTERVVFIDIDTPQPSPRPRGLLKRLFSKPEPIDAEDPAEHVLTKLEAYCQSAPARGARVYKTAAGLRVLLTGEQLDPCAEQTHDLFHDLGADPQYATLCRVQSCFRARLTPKPSRMRIGWPPEKIRAGSESTDSLRDWETAYHDECTAYAVCRLIVQIGPDTTDPDIALAQSIHDEHCAVSAQLPLA